MEAAETLGNNVAEEPVVERESPLIEPDEGESGLLEHVIEHTPPPIALSMT